MWFWSVFAFGLLLMFVVCLDSSIARMSTSPTKIPLGLIPALTMMVFGSTMFENYARINLFRIMSGGGWYLICIALLKQYTNLRGKALVFFKLSGFFAVLHNLRLLPLLAIISHLLASREPDQYYTRHKPELAVGTRVAIVVAIFIHLLKVFGLHAVGLGTIANTIALRGVISDVTS